MKNKLSLSVIVPAYNEEKLVEQSLERLLVLQEGELLERVQVVVVDDCSKDGTQAALQRFAERHRSAATRIPFEWVFIRHERNQGKGGAIQTALRKVTGDISIVHDADLEYYPADILKMVPLFLEEKADAIFGSRYIMGDYRYVLSYFHTLGNKLLTLWGNLFTNLNFTDMHTCYKAARTELLKDLKLTSRDFCVDPEIAIKLAKKRIKFLEVPIRYTGRTYDQGKKIGWLDGIKVIHAVVKFSLEKN